VAAQRADVQCPVRVRPVIVQLGDAVNVDEHLWRGEPQLDQRDEALTARKHLRLVAVDPQNIECLIEGAGAS
jgi:hypothetical protein